MNKYFLYIRKSTDEDDRQVLSLDAQETELRELAEKENPVSYTHLAESINNVYFFFCRQFPQFCFLRV